MRPLLLAFVLGAVATVATAAEPVIPVAPRPPDTPLPQYDPAVAPVRLSVTAGPRLRARGQALGRRELAMLEETLRGAVWQALERRNPFGPGDRLELTIVDARPSRPTFAEMSRTPGLSMQSVSLGGAEVQGVVIGADGRRRRVAYRWYETQLRPGGPAATWSDARIAFEGFARRLAEGRAYVRV